MRGGEAGDEESEGEARERDEGSSELMDLWWMDAAIERL